MDWLGDARVWKGLGVDWLGGRQSSKANGHCCSGLWKTRMSKASDFGVSDRTERGAIRPCSGLNTPLFLPFENGKKS